MKQLGTLTPETIGATKESFPLFRCPICKKSGVIDLDQFHGRVSIVCGQASVALGGFCEYHETKDWSAVEGGTNAVVAEETVCSSRLPDADPRQVLSSPSKRGPEAT